MGKKILIVDDDAEFIDKNKAGLESKGFDVVTATAVREVMDKIAFEMPDAIVLDLMMEKHDSGFCVAKQIKADPRFRNIPVLMVSSAMEETGADFCQELDGYWMKTDDFINKPVTADELADRVSSLIKK
ncbi:MAG TPA: response regulator [Syntrophorhabdaceae bacterium]|nr:response regulator [Syntrophorhabdaceae bacterium]